MSDEWKSIFMSNIKRRLTSNLVKCRADIEVSCYAYEGIDAIKHSLKEGLKMSTDDQPIKINLIAPPVYCVTLSSLDRNEGVDLLREVIEKIRISIETMKGKFKVKMAPKVVTEVDEAELTRQMNLLEGLDDDQLGWCKIDEELVSNYEAIYDGSFSEMINNFKDMPLPEDDWS
jgi:translation initiation factor 2 subunit 1